MTVKTNSTRGMRWVSGLAITAGIVIAAGGQARADAIIDGITIPTGATFVTQTIFENVVGAVGQPLQGDGRITEIDDSGGNQVWQPTPGQALTFTFTGFTATYVLAPTGTTAGLIDFSGGTFDVYVQSSSPNISSSGSQAQDLINATSATLFLSADAVSFPSSSGVVPTTTLEATIPAGATLNSFSTAGGSAFFDVTGGDAMSAFNTCSFSVSTPGGTCPPNTADLVFTETFNATTASTTDWPVSGTGKVSAEVAVPEPASLGLLGMALMVFGGIVRRRRQKA